MTTVETAKASTPAAPETSAHYSHLLEWLLLSLCSILVVHFLSLRVLSSWGTALTMFGYGAFACTLLRIRQFHAELKGPPKTREPDSRTVSKHPKPLARTAFKIKALIVIMLAATYIWHKADSIQSIIPDQLAGRDFWLLLSSCFFWTGLSYARAVPSVAQLMHERRLREASEKWTAVRTSLLFVLLLIAGTWLTTNVVLLLCDVPGPQRLLFTDWLKVAWLPQSAEEYRKGAVSFCALPDTSFAIVYILVLSAILASVGILRGVWTHFHAGRGAHEIPRSPSMLAMASAVLTLLCTAVLLGMLYLCTFEGWRVTLAFVKSLWPPTGLKWFFVSIGLCALFVLLGAAACLPKQVKTSLCVPRPSILLKVWLLLLILACTLVIVTSACLWLSLTDRDKWLSAEVKTAIGQSSSISVPFTATAWIGRSPMRAQWPLLNHPVHMEGEVGQKAAPEQSQVHNYLGPFAVAAWAWLVSLFVMGAYILPRSFVEDAVLQYEGRPGPKGRARIKGYEFLVQCLLDNPVTFLAGGALHVGTTILPLLCFTNRYLGLEPRAYTPSIAGLWLSSLPLFVGPIGMAYLNQRSHFAKSLARKLTSCFLGNLRHHLLIVGFGSLGRTILAKRWKHMALSLDFSLSDDFKAVVTPEGAISIVTTKAAVIDRDPKAFETLCKTEDPQIGCVTLTSDVIDNATVHTKFDKVFKNQKIRIPGLCADGSSERHVIAMGAKEAEWVVVVTDDDRCSEELYARMSRLREDFSSEEDVTREALRPAMKTPTIIKWDSGSYYRGLIAGWYDNPKHLRILNLYPQPDEAENLVRHVNPLLEDMSNPNTVGDGATTPSESLQRSQVLIVGGGRRVAYTCSALLSELSLPPEKGNDWIRDHVLLVTADDYIKASLVPLTLSVPQDQTVGSAVAKLLSKEKWPFWTAFWPIHLSNCHTTAEPLLLRTVPCPSIEYTPVRQAIDFLLERQTPVTILAFADANLPALPAVEDVLRDLPPEQRARVQTVVAHRVSARLPTVADETGLVTTNGVRSRAVVHDEVIAAEISSFFDVVRVQEAPDPAARTVSLYICKSDVPLILLWKTLVLGGYSPDAADLLCQRTLQTIAAKMSGVNASDSPAKVRIPSWHYYFTESAIPVANTKTGQLSSTGFRFRAGFGLEHVSVPTKLVTPWDKRNGLCKFAQFNWNDLSFDTRIPEWPPFFGLQTQSLDKSLRVQCSRLCLFTQEPCLVLKEGGWAASAPQYPTPTLGNIDVVCEGFEGIGTLAKMLMLLMAVNPQDLLAQVDDSSPIGPTDQVFADMFRAALDAPVNTDQIMDIRFAKCNEFCGPERTLATLHGELRDVRSTSKTPSKRHTEIEGTLNGASNIISVRITGSKRIAPYVTELGAFLEGQGLERKDQEWSWSRPSTPQTRQRC